MRREFRLGPNFKQVFREYKKDCSQTVRWFSKSNVVCPYENDACLGITNAMIVVRMTNCPCNSH